MLNFNELVKGFEKLGLRAGDVVLVHSSFKSFGGVEGGPQTVIDAILSVIGDGGTLIVPTFNFEFCKGVHFDIKNTPSHMGIISEFVRRNLKSCRVLHPIYSFSILGKLSQELGDLKYKSSYGRGSIFGKLRDLDGKIMLIGVSYNNSMTFFHHVEEMEGCDYRYFKNFMGTIIDENGNVYQDTFTMLVRDLEKGVLTKVDPMGELLEEKGIVNIQKVGEATVKLMKANEVYQITAQEMKKDPKLLYQIKDKVRTCAKDNFSEENDKNSADNLIGQEMYNLLKKLFPICRSITGNGVRKTLEIIKEHIPIELQEVPTGTKVFDWTIPKEWNIKDAYVMDEKGNKIIDFQKNNLHVLGYSVPVDSTVTLSELQEHLYSLPEQPEAINYVTSYYQERWGFSIAHKEREKLEEGKYKVFIDSELRKGSLTYGELIIPGETNKEVFLSTYVCHPSLANNELSGPVVTTFLARWLLSEPRKYTYRIIFIPETIGSITYLSRNLEDMKRNIIAGFNITCVGDNKAYSYLPTKYGNSYVDKAALNVLSFKHPHFIKYSFLDRGSDERQYNSVGVDLPVGSIMRSKYGEYPEYHTSLDNLNFVSAEGLFGAYDVLRECIEVIEKNKIYMTTLPCEPQLGKRGIYPTISSKARTKDVRTFLHFTVYADGLNDLIDISNLIKKPVWELYPIVEKLRDCGLIKEISKDYKVNC